MQLEVTTYRSRKLSLTSLIDVIFLLLLFFILSSTFTKYSKVELSKKGSGTTQSQSLPQVFVRVSQDQWNVNGVNYTQMNAISALQDFSKKGAQTLLLVVAADLKTQGLVDALELIKQETKFKVTISQ